MQHVFIFYCWACSSACQVDLHVLTPVDRQIEQQTYNRQHPAAPDLEQYHVSATCSIFFGQVHASSGS